MVKEMKEASDDHCPAPVPYSDLSSPSTTLISFHILRAHSRQELDIAQVPNPQETLAGLKYYLLYELLICSQDAFSVSPPGRGNLRICKARTASPPTSPRDTSLLPAYHITAW